MNDQAGRRPRVALVAHDAAGHGGMESALSELIRRGSAVFDFVVFSATLDPGLKAMVTWRRVPVPPRPVSLKFPLYGLLGALRLARDRFDLVCTVGAIVPNRTDVVWVHFCHAGFDGEVNPLEGGQDTRLRNANVRIVRAMSLLAERWCYRSRRTGVLAAVSEGLGRELKSRYPSVPVTVVQNGVDARRFAPVREPERSQLRSELGLSVSDVVAVFVGGDWFRKGLSIAIEGVAWARAAGAHSLRLCVVGPGNQARFSAIARSAGVGDVVTFLGPRRDTERIYQTADIFLMPTRYEAFSLAMLEALASGLPIVTTRVNGTEELFRNREPGYLVERTPEAVARALGDLVEDRRRREEMGDAGRAIASEYTWGRCADRMLEIFGNVVSVNIQGETDGLSELSRTTLGM